MAAEEARRTLLAYARGEADLETTRKRLSAALAADPGILAAAEDTVGQMLADGRLPPPRYVPLRAVIERLRRGDIPAEPAGDLPLAAAPEEGGALDDPTVVLERDFTVRLAGPAVAEEEPTRRLLPGEAAEPAVLDHLAEARRAADRAAASDPVRGDWRPVEQGMVIGDFYELDAVVGRGGMGVVWRAVDLRRRSDGEAGPYVAIKLLNEVYRTRPEAIEALRREAEKARELAHPNIVRVLDFDQDQGVTYMVMEYLEGEPLSRVIRGLAGGGMERRRVFRLVEAVGQALGHAHRRGVVHADLKPSNIFLCSDGQVKVLDFGIARAFRAPVDDAAEGGGPADVMTPAYASPEMLEGREADPRDDVYALAVVTYEMLAGRHPFERQSALHARDAHMMASRVRGLTRRQWSGLRAGLDFRRARRTPTVRQFVRELSRPGWTGRLLLLLVLGGLAAAWWALGRPGPEALWEMLRAEVEIALVHAGLEERADAVFVGLARAHPAARRRYAAALAEPLLERFDGHLQRQIAAYYKGLGSSEALAEGRQLDVSGALAVIDRAEEAFPGEPRLARWRDAVALALSDGVALALARQWPLEPERLAGALAELEALAPQIYLALESELAGELRGRIADAPVIEPDREDGLRRAYRILFPDAAEPERTTR